MVPKDENEELLFEENEEVAEKQTVELPFTERESHLITLVSAVASELGHLAVKYNRAPNVVKAYWDDHDKIMTAASSIVDDLFKPADPVPEPVEPV